MRLIKKTLLLSLGVLIAALAACNQSVQSDADYLARAKEFQAKGDPRATIIELKNALNANANNGEVRLLLGEQYLAIGDGASAEKELRRAKDFKPNDQGVVVLVARALLMQRKYQDVLNEFGTDVSKVDQNTSILVTLGDASRGVGDLTKASDYLLRAFSKDPKSTEVQLGLARLAFAEGDFAKTQEHLQRVFAAVPDMSDALLLSGDVAYKQARFSDAEATYSKLVKQDKAKFLTPWTFDARVGLIKSLLSQAKLENAKTTADALAKAAPRHPIAKYLQGLVAYQQQDYDKAMDYLQKTTKDLPNHLPSALLLGAIHYAKGNYEQADSYLSRFVNEVPTHVQGRKLLGALRLKQNRAAEAVEILSTAADQNADDAQLLAMVGRAAASSGDVDKGVVYMRKAMAASPENSVLRTELAQVYLRSGAVEEAIRELEVLAELANGQQAKIMLIAAYLRAKDFRAARALATDLNQEAPKDPMMKTLLGGINLLEGARDKAKASFNEALRLQVNFVPAKLNLARMALQDNDFDTAASYFDEVLRIEAKNVPALLGMAQIAEQKGDTPQTLAWLEKARAADSTALVPRLILGRHALQQEDIKKALDLAMEAYTHYPNEPAVLLLLGRAQSASGKNENALDTYQLLVKRLPNASGAYLELAKAQAKLGQKEQAKTAFRKALEITPDLSVAQASLALLEWETGNRTAAFSIVKRLQRSKHSALGFALMGDLYSAQGDWLQAQQSYEQSVKDKPHSGLVEKLARSYNASGAYDKAIPLLSNWSKTHPQDLTIRLVLADTYAEAKDFTKAEASYLQILASDPNNIGAHNNLALLYLPNDLEKAQKHAQEAYRLLPENPSVADTLGWILVKTGAADEGLEMLKRAAAQTQAPAVQYHLAAAMIKSGAKIQGRDILKRVLQANKSFKEKDEAQRLFDSL